MRFRRLLMPAIAILSLPSALIAQEPLSEQYYKTGNDALDMCAGETSYLCPAYVQGLFDGISYQSGQRLAIDGNGFFIFIDDATGVPLSYKDLDRNGVPIYFYPDLREGRFAEWADSGREYSLPENWITICPPTSSTSGQDQDIFLNYLRNHPEERHLTAAELFHTSMQEAFPCLE